MITVEYVTCKTCRSPDTELNKGENRLYFVTCNSCGSRRSVTAIKTGFSAQVGKRKRMKASYSRACLATKNSMPTHYDTTRPGL
jgi:uncharacterized Zn finger protein